MVYSSSLKKILGLAGESISERESEMFQEGNSFGKAMEFKKYLHGLADTGSKLHASFTFKIH